MKDMTLRNIADACGGILCAATDDAAKNTAYADVCISSLVTDSRQAGEGSLFAAIRGERTDGHRYIRSVYEQGALCVLTERDLGEDDLPADRREGIFWIRVPSTLKALQGIAGFYLHALGIPAVGIAGSVGKTSTKEMVSAVLSQKYRVHKTEGNFNNELGVPLTIFGLDEEDEIAVLEMGISDFGEMHRLSAIVHPHTVVMTNIGECHLEFLGDRDGVLRAKSEIFDYIQPEGSIILNGNDDKLRQLREVKGIVPAFYGIPESSTAGTNGASESGTDGTAGTSESGTAGTDGAPASSRIASAGSADAGDVTALSVWADRLQPHGLSGTDVCIHTPEGAFSCRVPIPGRHSVMNALAGTAAGLAYGLSLEEIRAGIESIQSVGGRLHMISADGRTVIDDCYNANPISMKASLSVLKDAGGKKAAILGDMAELGSGERDMHREVGACAADCGLDVLVTIGERAAWIEEGARGALGETGGPGLYHYDNVEAFLSGMEDILPAGSTVLVKASHCMHFEEIIKAFEKPDR